MDLVEVFLGPHPEADLIRSVLEGSGIPAMVRHEGSGAYPVTVGAMGDGRVLVSKERVDEAREVIKAALSGDLELP